MAISDEEGEQFMKSAQNVMRHYNVQTTQKTLDWVALMGVSATIYGTRLYAIMNREPSKPDAFKQSPRTATGSVTPIRPDVVLQSSMTIHPDQFGAGDIPAE